MLYGMADNNVNIPAQRDGAMYNVFANGSDFVIGGIGDELEVTYSGSSFLITLGTGEGVVGGRHVTEITEGGGNTTLQLDANESGYIVIRFDLTQPAGSETYLYATPVLVQQDINDTGTVRDLPLYSYTTDGSGVSSVTDLRNIKTSAMPDIITATLTAGSTSITISHSSIDTDSILAFYTSIYGVNPLSVSVSSGSVTLTFDAQSSNMVVGVRVEGAY